MDLGNLGNLDLVQLQQYLRGMNLPTQKEDFASNAESNGVPQDLVSQIRNSATERFNSPDEVLQAAQGH